MLSVPYYILGDPNLLTTVLILFSLVNIVDHVHRKNYLSNLIQHLNQPSYFYHLGQTK